MGWKQEISGDGCFCVEIGGREGSDQWDWSGFVELLQQHVRLRSGGGREMEALSTRKPPERTIQDPPGQQLN